MDILKNRVVCTGSEVSLTPKQNSHLIVCNMRDVISSTNKRERQHNRRKKENVKKLKPEIADISNKMNDTLSIVSPNVSVEEVKDSKTPLKENSTQINAGYQKIKKKNSRSKVLCRNSSAAGSIKTHFSPKPKVNEPIADDNHSKKNAFEVMMNARNKTIGSNTPGEEPAKIECGSISKSPAAVKRKLMLEEWAEKKGASKRKLDDEARGEYVELEMKKRAKRLKSMLVNGKDSSTSTSKNIPNISKRNKDKDTDEITNEQPKLKSKKQRTTKGSRRKKVNRLSSTDTEDSLHKPITKEVDIEFVSKLSSPIKKRDSLLGYFSKISSPNSSSNSEIKLDEATLEKTDKVIEYNVKCNGNALEVKSKRKLELTQTTTSALVSGRPKRSCARKARYDYDLELSSEKSIDLEVNSKRRSKRHAKGMTTSIETTDVEIVEVIDLNVSVEESISKLNDTPKDISCKKLAPVFNKHEKIKARQQFLKSGVPEKMKLSLIKQRQLELVYENGNECFPKISHVPQIDNTEIETISHLDNIKTQFTFKAAVDSPFMENNLKLTSVIRIEPDLKLGFTQLQKLPYIENKRIFVKDLKGRYDKFPTYRCYNQLREKYRLFSATDTELDTQQLSESFVVTSCSRRQKYKQSATSNPGEEKPPISAPNGELLFTEKYKPMTSDQVLVNISPVHELKNFLSSWRNPRLNSDYSDFEQSDSSNNLMGVCNSVVLIGPSSSGKTNAVFALANELNFNVLEINAGMKRTGKKLLQDLRESTQSHLVGKENSKNNPKLSLNGLKKRIENNNSNSSLDYSPCSSKLSLILVEDADILFEQDAGFIEAMYQLSSTSKRPVIFIANNPNCQHLLRLINQHAISFAKPNVLNISKFLSILSLIENCPIDLDDIVSLYLYNHRNLRKTLLEMQFFIQSGGDRTRRKSNNPQFVLTSPIRLSDEMNDDQDDCLDEQSEKLPSKVYVHKTLFEFYTTCQNFDRIVPFPINFNILWENLVDIFKVSLKLRGSSCLKRNRRPISPKKRSNISKEVNVLGVLTDFYENISTAAYISANSGFQKALCQPSITDEISHHLVEKSLKINLDAGVDSYNLFSKEKERTLLTSYISSNQLRSNRSVALDYEPCLRSICRSEKQRSQVERRGSRFYHYLRNTCNNLSSFSTDIFDNSCSVFLDSKDIL